MSRVADLAGAELALWVARACGLGVTTNDTHRWVSDCDTMLGYIGDDYRTLQWIPHEDWAQGGPLIEKHCVAVTPIILAGGEGWEKWEANVWAGKARNPGGYLPMNFYGETALIAAMRALVASVYGETVGEVVP